MSVVSDEEHPEVTAAKILARATREAARTQARAVRRAARLAAVTTIMGVCIGGGCAVTNTVVQTALPTLLRPYRTPIPPVGAMEASSSGTGIETSGCKAWGTTEDRIISWGAWLCRPSKTKKDYIDVWDVTDPANPVLAGYMYGDFSEIKFSAFVGPVPSTRSGQLV